MCPAPGRASVILAGKPPLPPAWLLQELFQLFPVNNRPLDLKQLCTWWWCRKPRFTSPGQESFNSLGCACIGRVFLWPWEIWIHRKAAGGIESSYGSTLSTLQGHPEVQALRPGSVAGPRWAHPKVTSRLVNTALFPHLVPRAGWEDGWTATVAKLASFLPVLRRKVLRLKALELCPVVVACMYLQETSHLYEGVSSMLMCNR